MKKLFFIAAIAGAALVGCTKNEVAQSVNEQQEITFASPIVGTTTKASTTPVYGLLTGAYPKTVSFGVWGWYSEAASYDPETAVAYMTNVEVAYKGTDHNETETEEGAWEPATPYYWPKNGKITFDAYSPIELTGVSSDKATGLTIKDYTVPTDNGKQIDVLYSSRAYDKNSSIGNTNAPYNTYEGVDIVFNHALSAIAFTIASDADYGKGTIKLQSITVNAHSTGTFTQNINASKVEVPAWTSDKSENYVIWEAPDYDGSQDVTTTVTAAGKTFLMLPQVFTKSEAIVYVKYYIKNNNEQPLLQTAIFKLYDSVNQSGKEGDEAVTVDKWEMGKIYTYNLTIGLQGIYFAPTINAWDDVTVNLPQINN